MTIRATVNLILDNEASSQIEEIIKPFLGSEMSTGACGEEVDIIAKYIKRLGDESIEDIRLRVVSVEDVW
jgi:hypothetical protein